MKIGYVVSYDAKRAVGFIRASEDDSYEAIQLSKHYRQRADQQQLLMFRDDVVAAGVPLVEGLRVRFEVGKLESDESSVWRVASTVVPDAEDSTDSEAPLEGAADQAPADDGTEEEVAAQAELTDDVAQSKVRDVGFAEEYEEDWDASSWGEDSWA